jgi:hypothetical protein
MFDANQFNKAEKWARAHWLVRPGATTATRVWSLGLTKKRSLAFAPVVRIVLGFQGALGRPGLSSDINILANEKVLARLKLPDLTAISANSMRNSPPLPPLPKKKTDTHS